VAVATILFLAANPAATSRLALDEEARAVEQELRMAQHRDAFAVRALWAPRPLDLLRGLNEARPAIVHFAGHGAAADGIVLPDEAGGQVAVAGEALRRLFEEFPQTVRLVVLNACFSHEQCDEVKEAIGCAIGMSAAMGDVAARRFAEALYSALGAGCSIKAAFDQAVALLHIYAGARGDADASVPVLSCRAEVDPDRIAFAGAPPPGTAPAEPDAGAVVRAARRALNGLDARERELAIETLGSMDGAEARAALAEALQHPLRAVRAAAAIRFPDRRDPRIIRGLIDWIAERWNETPWPRGAAERLVEAVQAAGPAAVPELLAVLDEATRLPDGLVVEVVWVLEKVCDARAVPVLVRLVRHHRYELVRSSAVDVLARIGDASVAADVRALLDDEYATMRSRAALALGQLRDPGALPLLTALLRRDVKEVREAAARGLAHLRDAAAVPDLLQSLADPDLHVRIAAAHALACLGEAAGLDHLRALLRAQPDTHREISGDDEAFLLALIPFAGDEELAAIERRIVSFRSGSTPDKPIQALIALGSAGEAIVIRILDARPESSSVSKAAAEALERVGSPAADDAVARWRMLQ